MGETELLKKYDSYIARHARSYLRKTNQPDHLYEDMKSEATLAFLETVRRYQMEQQELSPREFLLLHNAMRGALRSFVWHYNGQKNKNMNFDKKKVLFSEFADDDPDGDASKLDFLSVDDDYDAVELQDAIDRLPKAERETANLLMDGYNYSEIARMQNISPQTVRETVLRLKTHLDISA